VVLGVGLGRIGCFLNGCCYGGLSDLPWAVRFPEESPAFADQAQRGELYLHGLLFHGAPREPAVIDRVEPGSAAEEHGLRAGQRVVMIDKVRTGTVEDAQWELLKLHGAGKELSIQVAGASTPVHWTLSQTRPRSRPVHPAQLYSLIDALLLCLFLLAYEPFKRRDGELTALVLVIHPISRFLLEIIRVDESAVFNTGMSISQNISIAIFAGGVMLWIYLFTRPPGLAWPGVVAGHGHAAPASGSFSRAIVGKPGQTI
jgi:phosphatidylglycerol:prolipoprotein diacylglycerol transferase